jgi:hypothetical protein
MKRQGLYRLFSSLVNSYALLVAVSLVMGFFSIFTSAFGMLQAFIGISTVLYAWYANQFFVKVIVLQGPFTKKKKDLLQVNAIVVAILSLLAVISTSVCLIFFRQVKQVLAQNADLPIKDSSLILSLVLVLGIGLVLGIHVFWTIRLVRKHKAQITDEPPTDEAG